MSPRLTRRQFLAGTVASGVALGSPKLFASPKLKSLTDQVKLGNTGIKASYLGFGTGTKGVGRESNQTRLGIVQFSRMINHAFDQGINYFDAADYYGTHEYLRSALKRIPREKYVLSSKIWYRTSKSAQEDLDRFLRELGTDYIDILFIHCVTEPSWAADLREMVEVLEAAKQKGIIRAHGISIHNLDVLKGVPDNPWVDICLARINPVGPFMDGRPDEVVPVLKKIHDAGKAVTGIKILGEGRIADQREKSMRYVLGLECVDSIVIGFESCDQINDILAIGRRILA